MKIFLPKEAIGIIASDFFGKIDIIKVKSHSTIISINMGKDKYREIEIPYKLDSSKQYKIKISENKLQIIEQKIISKQSADNKNQFYEILENLLNYKAEGNKENNLFSSLFNIFFEKKRDDDLVNNDKKDNLFFSDKESDSFYFIFSISLYKIPSKIVLKIDKNKNTFINIYLNKKNDSKELSFDTHVFLSEIKKQFKDITASLNVKIFDEQKEFINETSIMFRKNIVDYIK